MKFKSLLVALLLGCMAAQAQQADPVIMTINGQPVLRSEFEYSYNKNNSEGVIDKKTVSEYVDLFINYKLKVAAAYDAKIDTLSSFKKEFRQYRDQQIRPSFVADKDIEAEALKVYNDTKTRIGDKGLVHAAHILLYLPQDATDVQKKEAEQRADSIYTVLQSQLPKAENPKPIVGKTKKGKKVVITPDVKVTPDYTAFDKAFADMATKYSQDPGSSRRGGDLQWLSPGQTLPEFENAAFALKVGEMSKPVLSAVGYHIIYMKGRKQLEPFDSLKTNIVRFLESRNVRMKVANDSIQRVVAASAGKLTTEDVLDQRTEELTAKDNDLKNLIREYHDGLMLFEISNQNIWDKAAKDEAGLAAYFKKHKKDYSWSAPRYKGMAYHVKNQADVDAVKNSVKGLAFDQWADKLRSTFNNDTIIRIRVEKGIFKEGDNAFIDKMVFKKDTTVQQLKDYPIDAVYGKLLKKGPEEYKDVKGLVTADYQNQLEKQWVAELRKKYTFSVNNEVLATVNKHEDK